MICVSVCLSGAHPYVYDFKSTVSESDVILIGKVEKVKAVRNGYKYSTVIPIGFVKGGGRYDRKKKIRYGMPYYGAQEDSTCLRRGDRYIFFIRSVGSCYILVGGSSGYYKIDGDGKLIFYNVLVSSDVFITKIKNVMRD